jgi:hypothetical protein
MAKQAVYHGHQVKRDSVSQLLPHNAASVFIDGVKQTSDVGPNLRFHTGSVEARWYYLEKCGWDALVFDNTDWSSLNDTLATKPKLFHACLCNQAANYSATGTNIGQWFGQEYTACPNCQQVNEWVGHLLCCPDAGRTAHICWRLSTWRSGSPRGIPTRTLRIKPSHTFPADLCLLAGHQDDIGWRNMLKGKISTKFRRIQENYPLSLLGTATTLPEPSTSLSTNETLKKLLSA